VSYFLVFVTVLAVVTFYSSRQVAAEGSGTDWESAAFRFRSQWVPPALGILGAVVLAGSLTRRWHVVNRTDGVVPPPLVERGWDVQPLGLIVLVSTVLIVAVCACWLARIRQFEWSLVLGAAVATYARLHMLFGDSYMAHQDDYSRAEGVGYEMLILTAAIFVVAWVYSRAQREVEASRAV
jgi:hypothetical protein